MTDKKIALVVNSRAEAGPMESVIFELPEADVIKPYPMEPCVMQRNFAGSIGWFQGCWDHLKPALVIVLGDRFETLAAALSAFMSRIPIAHIHGGETTTGAFDNAFRHSITHMAALHFVATQQAACRVDNLLGGSDGAEFFDNIHLVGAPGLDGIEPRSAKRDKKRFLVTFHPETLAADYGLGHCRAMLQALRAYPDYEIVFTGVNADPGGDEIAREIRTWMASPANTSFWSVKMTHQDFVKEMQHAALVIGNSSAGIIEAPWVGVPTVDIGARQNGRAMADSVYQCDSDIGRTISFALKHVNFNPRYIGLGAGEKIAQIVNAFPLTPSTGKL